MESVFSLELLQAISDWQQGGNARAKHHRGKMLKTAASSIDSQFRRCDPVVFRKIDLRKTPLWKLLADGKLPETISSWTTNIEVAKHFKNGVPPKGWQGIIVACQPTPENTILNLSALYANTRFLSKIEALRGKISGFDLGMGKYSNLQHEVIIEKEALAPSDIYAMGGFSSDPQEIGKIIFGRKVTDSEIEWMRDALKRAGEDFGAWWVEGDAMKRALNRTLSRVPELKRVQRLQSEHKQRRMPLRRI